MAAARTQSADDERAALLAAEHTMREAREKLVDPPAVASDERAPQGMPPEVLAKAYRKEGAAPAKPAEDRYHYQREQKQNEWLQIVSKDVTVQDLLRPSFWASMARKMKTFDTVVVESEDKQMYVELLVVASAQTWTEMRLKGEPIIVPASVAGRNAMTDYEVIDGGLIKKWCVTEKRTGREISIGHTIPEAGWNWLREFLAQNNRAA